MVSSPKPSTTEERKTFRVSSSRERLMESKPGQNIKLLCSYGGKIRPRTTDGELRYVGGHTRVLTVHRSISFSELMVKLTEFCGSSVILKCQLPKGDLETLISITNDEDLANIIEEYDRASLKLAHPMKIKAVLLPPRSLKKVSSTPTLSSASSSASHSPARSPHTSAESLPYGAYRYGCNYRTPPLPAAPAATRSSMETIDCGVVDLTATITATEASGFVHIGSVNHRLTRDHDSFEALHVLLLAVDKGRRHCSVTCGDCGKGQKLEPS
ncbi:hypothetical protein V8G54_005651 [Vigna mungo]|uniref:PB1 domain-containing protein n=1 Tax=Vigna mungo TaxID=3915 RepID=A0AAQ3NYE3_VIGMU